MAADTQNLTLKVYVMAQNNQGALRNDIDKRSPALLMPVMLAIAWVISLASGIASFSPRLLVGLLVAFFLLCVFVLVKAEHLTAMRYKKNFLLVAALAFVGYILLSALWSAYPLTALQKGLWLTLVIFSVSMTPLLLAQMSPLQLYRCARGILIGLLIGAIFLIEEYATGFAILSFGARQFPDLVQTIGPEKQVPLYFLNNNVTVLVLLIWPALLITLPRNNKKIKSLGLALVLGGMLFILYKTQSATAQLAFLLAAITWLAARFMPNHIHLIARSLWTLAVIGVIPVIMAVHYVGLQKLTSLPYSFRDRLHIWNYTARLVPESPVLGIGIRSNRANQIEKHRQISHAYPGKLFDHKGWHSHNMFLQTWYELGAIGSGFILLIGLLMLKGIERIEEYKRPFAYAAMTSFSIIAAFGYGMWQSWLLATYGWTAIFLLIALKYEKYKR